jgi:hypothetical protein
MDAKYLTLGKRNQLTLPREVVAEGAVLYRCERREDGAILLTPQVPVPASQAYFWTKRWQEGEKKASDDIRGGKVRKFASADALSGHLDRKRRR